MILLAQGFKDQLAQYKHQEFIEGYSNLIIFAEHCLTGVKVAIKVIKKNLYKRLTYENNISEAEAMWKCRESRHIVELIEKFEHEGKIFLVTKYARAGDLLTYCMHCEDPENWMSVEQARHIFIQVAKGLQHMHHAGLFHRDLKPLNIFLCDDSEMPRVKIGDLGLSVSIQPGVEYIKRAGTTPFMAPEVMLDQPSDAKSDIWSLGILLYTLLTSHLPFESSAYA